MKNRERRFAGKEVGRFQNLLKMKKIKFFSIAALIRGRKSSGKEDYSSYKNWKALSGDVQ